MTESDLSAARYDETFRAAWDGLVDRSRNGTFLFRRDFMEYHSDRYEDCSLVILDQDRPVALLPASRDGDTVVSHGGLTYGGLVVGDRLGLLDVQKSFMVVLSALRADSATKLVYKTIPSIYHAAPTQEDLHCLFLLGAALIRRDVLTVVDLRHTLPFQSRRRRAIKSSSQARVVVGESVDFPAFWTILTTNLETRHGVRPVHSLPEIALLAAAFPAEIKLVAASVDGCMVAGAVVFVSKQVCHIQYNAASAEGRSSGALDAVLAWLLERYRSSVRFLDLGISTEREGREVNSGLVEFKEGFGGRTIVHDFYELDLLSVPAA